MNLGSGRWHAGPEGSFKAREADTLRKGYATLRNEGPERNLGSFDPSGLYLSLRSPSAYSLPSTSRCASFGRAGRVPFGGRVDVTSSMKIQDYILQNEVEIVWERDPEEMDYVRQRACAVNNRSGSVPKTRIGGEVVGYAILDDETECVDRPGWYRRRVFFLKDHDRPQGGDVFQGQTPAEAVDPLTVEAGVVGEVTPRARGEADVR